MGAVAFAHCLWGRFYGLIVISVQIPGETRMDDVQELSLNALQSNRQVRHQKPLVTEP